MTATLRPPRRVADLVTVTGLSRNSVYTAIRLGQLPGFFVGKRVVIPADAFDAFCRGDWQPQPRPIAPIHPLIIHRKAG